MKKKFSVNHINITESNVQKFALIWEYNCSLTKLTRHLASTDCLKSVRIWSYPGLHFPAFGLNTERYGVTPNNSEYRHFSRSDNQTVQKLFKVEKKAFK